MPKVLHRLPEVVRGGEADLIEPVQRAGEVLLSATGVHVESWSTFLEVACEYGVIDVVHVVFDETELTRRHTLGLAAVPERRLRLTLHCLQAAGGRATAAALAQRGLISEGRMRKVVGPELERRGWVRLGQQYWDLTSDWVSPVRRLLAVEIKQNDVGGGLAQARRYAAAAQWVAVAVGPTRITDRSLRWCQDSGVALARVDDGVVTVLSNAAPQRDLDPLSRIALTEQVLHMQTQGLASGPVRPVFGRMLLSAERDPRLADVSG